MRYLADLGHLEGKTADLVVARAREDSGYRVRLEGRDKAGQPWTLRFRPDSGVGWTVAYLADFDRDGQQDLAIGSHFPGNGACTSFAKLLVLLFDERGRPVPWLAETEVPHAPDRSPYRPALVVDANRDGRAEFILTRCWRPEIGVPAGAHEITGVYEASAGRLTPVRNPPLAAYRQRAGGIRAGRPADWKQLLPGLQDPASGVLEEFATGGFGCQAFQPPPRPVPAGSSRRIADTPDPCDDSRRPTTKLSGRSIRSWPRNFVLDSPQGREIELEGGPELLDRTLRTGWPVRLLPIFHDAPDEEPDFLLWADGNRPAERREVSVVLEVAAQRASPAPVATRDGDCWSLLYTLQDPYTKLMRVRRCPATRLWSQSVENSRDELAPDLRTVRHGYTAMGHTERGETRYEQPPGALALRAVAEIGDLQLAEWTHPAGRRFALHCERGTLVAAEVQVPVAGTLLGPGSPLVFVDDWARPRTLTEVRGRIVWRRAAR